MPAQAKVPATSSALLATVLDQLACPACFASLRLEGHGLICAGCLRIYPMVDGIPVLIAEASEPKRKGAGDSGDRSEIRREP
jgi:uncharacterized protein YbaR (Trm112 family)